MYLKLLRFGSFEDEKLSRVNEISSNTPMICDFLSLLSRCRPKKIAALAKNHCFAAVDYLERSKNSSIHSDCINRQQKSWFSDINLCINAKDSEVTTSASQPFGDGFLLFGFKLHSDAKQVNRKEGYLD